MWTDHLHVSSALSTQSKEILRIFRTLDFHPIIFQQVLKQHLTTVVVQKNTTHNHLGLISPNHIQLLNSAHSDNKGLVIQTRNQATRDQNCKEIPEMEVIHTTIANNDLHLTTAEAKLERSELTSITN